MASQPVKCLQMSPKRLQMSPNCLQNVLIKTKGRVGVGRQVLTKKDQKVRVGRFGNAEVGSGLNQTASQPSNQHLHCYTIYGMLDSKIISRLVYQVYVYYNPPKKCRFRTRYVFVFFQAQLDNPSNIQVIINVLVYLPMGEGHRKVR